MQHWIVDNLFILFLIPPNLVASLPLEMSDSRESPIIDEKLFYRVPQRLWWLLSRAEMAHGFNHRNKELYLLSGTEHSKTGLSWSAVITVEGGQHQGQKHL